MLTVPEFLPSLPHPSLRRCLGMEPGLRDFTVLARASESMWASSVLLPALLWTVCCGRTPPLLSLQDSWLCWDFDVSYRHLLLMPQSLLVVPKSPCAQMHLNPRPRLAPHTYACLSSSTWNTGEFWVPILTCMELTWRAASPHPLPVQS